jgi:hypothetical protein
MNKNTRLLSKTSFLYSALTAAIIIASSAQSADEAEHAADIYSRTGSPAA